MAYRKFKAQQLFDGYRFRNENDVLITDENGTVLEIVPTDKAGDDVQQYDGILSPGLVNCHCHLELSHLKDIIPPHTGLVEFLRSVVTLRGLNEEKKQQAMIDAEQEMYNNGTVAVGDIGNTADTVFVKNNSNIYWQNFVEVLNFKDENAQKRVEEYKKVANELAYQISHLKSQTSLVPHAPYSISPKTFQLINEATAGQIISVHNQETDAENELFQTGKGAFLTFFQTFGMEQSPFPVTGKSSVKSWLPYFNQQQTIFLVHNTCMSEEDMVWANEYASSNGLKLVYCFCINANLYIENKTPLVEQFLQHNCLAVLGTDSYSSNWQLSIAKEIQSLLKHTKLTAAQALQMATINGAKALQRDDQFGSFEKGKRPGIVLLKNDFSGSIRVL